MPRSLALDNDGNMSWCSVPANMRGTNGCPHKAHQMESESTEEFTKRMSSVAGPKHASNWREEHVQNDGESDGDFQNRLAFNRYLARCEADQKLEETQADRNDLDNDYGVKSGDVQDRVVIALAAYRKEMKYGIHHGASIDLASSKSSIEKLVPDTPDELKEDLKRYFSIQINREDEEEGFESVFIPRNLRAAREISNPERMNMDDLQMDKRFIECEH